MTVRPTGIQAANLLSFRGQAQLQRLCQQTAAKSQSRIGIQKDGQLVLYSGRHYLLHPQQTRRAAQFLQSLHPAGGAQARLDQLAQITHGAMQQRHAVLRGLLRGAKLNPVPLLDRTSAPTSARRSERAMRPGPGPGDSPQRPTTGWRERLQHAAERIRADKTKSPPTPPTPLQQAKRRFLSQLALNVNLAQDVRKSMERFAADVVQAPAAEKAGLFRAPLANTDLVNLYQDLARQQRTVATLDLHQRAHLIKTMLSAFKQSDQVLSQWPAQTVYARQRHDLHALLSDSPTPAACAAHAAIGSAFHALAQAYQQAPVDSRQPYNQASIGAQAILFDIRRLPPDPSLAQKTAAVLAYWS